MNSSLASRAKSIMGVTVRPNAAVLRHYPDITAVVTEVTSFDYEGHATAVRVEWEDGDTSVEDVGDLEVEHG